MSETTTNDAPAEPRRRPRPGAGRPRERTGYAGMYAELQSRVRHAGHALQLAAQSESPEAVKALLLAALKTLSEE